MRLTTKIISGIILSIFFISLTFIIGFSFTDRKDQKHSNSNVINLPQDNITSIELGSFKTIVIEEIQFESKKNYFGLSDNCNIFFDPPTENNNTDMLFIPAALKDFISIATTDDTLTIKLNLLELGKKYKNNEYSFQAFSGINMYFKTSKLDIINFTKVIPVNIKNIETDSIKITSNGNIRIDSCKALFIDPKLTIDYRNLNVTNSEIKIISLDLDNIRNWNIENCTIEEEYITGSGKHHITQHRKESTTINWIPKNENAELNIKIPGETTKIIIP